MEIRPLTDDELYALCKAEYDAAEQYSDELSDDRAQGIDYYYSRPLGDEVEGRSRVVTSDVADVIEWMMPGLVRTVAGDDELVAFQGLDDEQAKTATLLVQHVVDNQNDGFRIKHDTIKDGLLSKTGAVKWRWVKKQEPIDRDYEGLTDIGLVQLLHGIEARSNGANVSIVGQRTNQHPDGTVTYDVRVRVLREWGQVEIETIPPEELRIPRNARVIDDTCRYVAHDPENVTRGDLVAMGIPVDVALDCPAEDYDDSLERISRSGTYTDDAPPENKMAQYVDYVEHYVLCDADGDGILERRLICTSGDKILRNEAIPSLPVAVWSPFRMPHSAVGRSLAERVIDLQRVSTSLLRGTLDNIYTVNAGGRYVAQVGSVNMDDLLTMRAAGVVRAKDINALRPLPVEYIGDKTMQVMELVRSMREERTGVNRHNQGVNSDTLHQTFGGAAMIIEQGEELKEMVIRMYCEFLLKPMYRGVLDLLVRYQDTAMQLRVAGKPLTIDPSGFTERFGLKVKVGAGNQRKRDKIAALTNVLSSQAEALKGGLPIIDVARIYSATADLTELVGLNAERYWMDPKSPEAQMAMAMKGQKQPPVDPLVQAEMVKAQSREKEAAARLSLQQAKDGADAALKHEEMLRADQRAYTEMELKYGNNVPGSRV